MNSHNMDGSSSLTAEVRRALYLLLRRILSAKRIFLLRSDILDILEEFEAREEHAAIGDSDIYTAIRYGQVLASKYPWIYLASRPEIGNWEFFRFQCEDVLYEQIEPRDYLRFEEALVAPKEKVDEFLPEIDFGPFNRNFPQLQDSHHIGKGVEFLNRHLSGKFFQSREAGNASLFNFLRLHHYQGKQLMLNGKIGTVEALRKGLRKGQKILAGKSPDSEWNDFSQAMHELGFEAGWGRKLEDIRENFGLLLEILEAPTASILAKFLSRMPMVFNLLIVSPHGYFGQSGVLGLPDTGGQVVYILDQVRAVEQEMRTQIYNQGLEIQPRILVLTRLIPEAGDTTCDQRLESIIGTENSHILRVPFRNKNGEVVPQWVSRFHIWPYLEQFALDSRNEVVGEMNGKPDLIVGNYSDGNLVATLLSKEMRVTQCNIAHALEKSKYLFSAQYWRENEPQYRFSAQFTSDLTAMNAADFIITSTYQEIAGKEDIVGQYETYQFFSLPQLYRVINGVNVFDYKFNIVSPGADSNVYFPYFEQSKRLLELIPEIEDLVFGEESKEARGKLGDQEKPIILTMARMDRVKNLVGLVQWYAENSELQGLANLLVVGGHINPDDSQDHEERGCILDMHNLLDSYGLTANVRWVGRRLEKNLSGELYRFVADKSGAFVQPALFEAFGLTVVEAMSSGLPVFATIFGGPLEIVEDNISGFHINPNKGRECAERMVEFFRRSSQDKAYWEEISKQALERVRREYNWDLYAKKLLSLSRIYGFWKYVSNLEREETRCYLDIIYSLLVRRLIA
ncbi:MAG: sucrose synthase [Desulfonatronovibrionaceae bacterium]